MIKSQFLVLLKIDETCTFDAKFTCPLIWERHITFITTIFIMTMFTIYDEVLMILMGKKTRSLSSRQDIKAVNLQHPNDPNDIERP